MQTSKHPVVHFEMPYDNAKRVAAFYATTFGWDMNQMDAQMGNYIVAATADTDKNHMVTRPGAINGGFYPKSSSQAKYPSVVIAVDDIDAAMKAITANGGKILGEPVDIHGVGRYVSFTDTEGNRVSILQPMGK